MADLPDPALPPRSRPGAAGVTLGLLLLLWPWAALPFTWQGETRDWLLATRGAVLPLFAALSLLVLALAGGGRELTKRWLRLAPTGRFALGALALFLAWNLLSALAAKEPLAASLQTLWTAQAAAVTVGFALYLVPASRRNILPPALAASGALLGLIALLARHFGWHWAYYLPGRLKLAFGMPSMLGAFSSAALLCALALFNDALPRQPRRALLAAFAGVLSAIALALTGTRSCYLAALAGVALFIFWRLPRRARALFAAAAAALLLLALLFLALWLKTPGGETALRTESWGTRPLFVETSLRLAAVHPLFGWGPGNFAHGARERESPACYLHPQHGGYALAAHCEPAQLLAELGLPGLLLWLLLFASAFAASARARARAVHEGRLPETSLGPAGAAALLLFAAAADCLTNPAYRHIEFAGFLALLLGWNLSAGAAPAAIESAPPPPPLRTRAAAFFWILAAAGTLYFAAQLLAAHRLRPLAIEEMKTKDFAAAERTALALMTRSPDLDLWQRAATIRIDALLERRAYAPAAAALAEFDRRLPAVSVVLLRQLEIDRARQDAASGLAHILAALRWRTYDYRYRYELRTALRRLPLATLADWHRDERLGELSPERTAWLTPDDWDYLLAEALFQHGNPDEAADALLQKYRRPGEEPRVAIVPLRSELGRMLVEAGRFAEALAVLEPVGRQSPLEPDALVARARALAAEGTPEAWTGALETLSLSHTLFPGHADTARTLARWLIRAGRDAEAAEALERTLAITRRAGDLHVLYIQTLRRLGRPEEAAALANARALLPRDERFARLASGPMPETE